MLLYLLDDERNDFYIHVDRSAKGFDPVLLKSVARHSKVELIPSISVAWGGYSMVRCELMLLKAALPGEYAYYHLLSGADLPLKTPKEIHAFFDRHQGEEFIHFCGEDFNQKRWVRERISLYHPLQEQVGKSRGALFLLEKAIGRLQRLLGMDRLKKSGVSLNCGAQWFSITHALASFILENEAWIEKHFRSTYIGDEAFLQTLLASTERKFLLHGAGAAGDYRCATRLIDFQRGCPYTFRMGDLKELLASDRCFARKFDSEADRQICEALYRELISRKERNE